MAIICGTVQLFDHIFFQGLLQPYPKFSSKLLLFFLFHRAISGGFFSVILSFCLMRYVKLVENSNWFLNVPQKTHADFCHTLGFFGGQPNSNVDTQMALARVKEPQFLNFQLKKIPSRTNHFFRRWLKVERLTH